MTNVKKEILEWILTIGAAVLIAFIINMLGGLAVVDGDSMNNTLKNKEILIRASYRGKTPSIGDIVAFKTNMTHPWKIYRLFGVKKALVKRVIGIPGDIIKIEKGEVYRNGELLDEPYLKDDTTNGEIFVEVPEGHLFVMGDNRLNSNDSRSSSVGFVSMKDLIGKVSFRLIPINKIGTVK